jgi:hypothetical protein
LLLLFLAMALSFWRWAYADHWHATSVVIAGAIWSSLPISELSMRHWSYALVVAWLLFCGLRQCTA